MSESLFRFMWTWLWNQIALWATMTMTQIDDDAAAEALKPAVIEEVVVLLKKWNIIRKP